jgi:hypothetical protein
MGMVETIDEAVRREVEPLLLRCAEIRAELDRTEDALPILLDKDAIRIDLITRRAKLESVIAELQGNEVVEQVLRLAKERWPSWR